MSNCTLFELFLIISIVATTQYIVNLNKTMKSNNSRKCIKDLNLVYYLLNTYVNENDVLWFEITKMDWFIF